MVSKEEMPADLDAIMLQQTDDAKEHVLLLEMLWHTNIEDLHPLSGVVTLVCRSSIMSSTNMVAAYLSELYQVIFSADHIDAFRNTLASPVNMLNAFAI